MCDGRDGVPDAAEGGVLFLYLAKLLNSPGLLLFLESFLLASSKSGGSGGKEKKGGAINKHAKKHMNTHTAKTDRRQATTAITSY